MLVKHFPAAGRQAERKTDVTPKLPDGKIFDMVLKIGGNIALGFSMRIQRNTV